MKLAPNYPVRVVCEVLGLARSSYYHQPKQHDEDQLREAIAGVAQQWPAYGYRRITAQLKREGVDVNSKRVRRLIQEMGLKPKKKRARVRTTDSKHPYRRYENLVEGLEVNHPEQVWVAEIV